MGHLAYKHQVRVWLHSLRKLGEFKDEAVIVTDKPACIAKTLMDGNLIGDNIKSTDDLDVYLPGKGYAGNVHIVKRPSVHKVIHMKLEKARAWLNINTAEIPHPVSSIIYTDEDIVMAKPLNNFVSLVRTVEKGRYTLACFEDQGVSKGEIHTGVVVMFPTQASEGCLRAWGKKLTGMEVPPAPQFSLKSKVADEALKEEFDGRSTVLDTWASQSSMGAEAMGPDQMALGNLEGHAKRAVL
jgi:hypothetical protein